MQTIESIEACNVFTFEAIFFEMGAAFLIASHGPQTLHYCTENNKIGHIKKLTEHAIGVTKRMGCLSTLSYHDQRDKKLSKTIK